MGDMGTVPVPKDRLNKYQFQLFLLFLHSWLAFAGFQKMSLLLGASGSRL
jgi:hypothetical protein